MAKSNKFWLENISSLISNLNLVPLDGMNLAEQMNSITRLVIIVFIILILVGMKSSFLFLLLSLLFIIILYYIQRNNMETQEHYKLSSKMRSNPSGNRRMSRLNFNKTNNGMVFKNPTSNRFCNNERIVESDNFSMFNNKNWMSANQKLVGKANPKTLIPPVVVAPAADLSYWRANNLVNHSAINAESQIDVYQSGYQVSTCCAPSYDCSDSCKIATPVNPSSSYNVTPGLGPQGVGQQDVGQQDVGQQVSRQQDSIEHFKFPYMKSLQEQSAHSQPHPRQIQTSGLPSNFPAGNCMQNPAMKQYNENLFTQTIQPGMYTRSQINEPVNSNIGISYTQQFQPTTCKQNPKTGAIMYTEHDPRIIEPPSNMQQVQAPPRATESNIYDPRFSGYGTSYRSYNDDLTGQTRFYYDDIDAVKMPNYIVRSHIDNQPFADQYGPIKAGDANGNKYNPNIRALANAAFLDNAIEFRTDLMQKLSRKANARAWQQRMAPIHTGGQRMLGGMSCK